MNLLLIIQDAHNILSKQTEVCFSGGIEHEVNDISASQDMKGNQSNLEHCRANKILWVMP